VNFIEIENGITNLNFFILFITMLLYWFKSSALIGSKWLALSTGSVFLVIFTNYLSLFKMDQVIFH
jgi:membrane-bound metal-dependent hydrolase YbcI (DUF457 family)